MIAESKYHVRRQGHRVAAANDKELVIEWAIANGTDSDPMEVYEYVSGSPNQETSYKKIGEYGE